MWVCITAPLIGLAIIAADRYAVASKKQILAAKAEADRYFESRNYQPAIARYDSVIARSRGSRDVALRAASEEAEQRRALAAATLAEQVAAEKRRAEEVQAALISEKKRDNQTPLQRALDNSSSSLTVSTARSSSSYRTSSWVSPNITWRAIGRMLARTDPPPSFLSSSPGYTATGIPLHVGPRGGVYHYSKSGKKVYHSRRRKR
jgi:hypothetical protein